MNDQKFSVIDFVVSVSDVNFVKISKVKGNNHDSLVTQQKRDENVVDESGSLNFPLPGLFLYTETKETIICFYLIMFHGCKCLSM